MDYTRRFYQTIVDTVKRKFRGVADVVQGSFLRISVKSYAGPLVVLSRSTAIDDRVCHLAKILEDYAQNPRNTNPRYQDRVNATMVKLFHKGTMSQDTNAGAKNLYYNCVNPSATRDFSVTPEHIYDRLLRSTNLQNHPRAISSLAFAFAAILSLSLHRKGTSQSNPENKTSPYFDLSPLYGSNEMETSNIRMNDGRGMLSPDSFTEERLDMLPDSVPALLVLWNRYHNYVAKQLLSYNEHNRWYDPIDLTPGQCSKQDNEIFHIARSITCIHFINVVREDFLKGLVGMSIAGPSAQVDILYDVRGRTKAEAGYLSSVESYLLYSFSSFAPSSFASKVRERLKQRDEASADPDMRHCNGVGNLRRNKDGFFEDNDLAELVFDAIETKAGCPGGKAVPDWAREREILKLKQARHAKVCTLNEFRQHLGLKPLQSFEEWNPELASTAHDIYDDINQLELYPGLLCESSDGYGFGFGYTMTWGLIADIVTRIRYDPMFTSDFREDVLTKWGYKDCMSGVDVNPMLCSAGGSLGGMLPKLLQRTLPCNCPYNNIYCLFPFVSPEKSKTYVENCLDQKKYEVNRPKQAKIKVLRTLKAIREVLNDPEIYTSPYKQSLIELTGGYGHMLGFDYLPLHDRDLMLTLFSLMPDKGAVQRIGAYFAQKAQENLQCRAEIKDDVASIDVVKDVIDATCIRWICETLYNFHFKDNSTWKMSKSETNEARIESQKMEEKERDNFASCYAYIFRNFEPEFGWSVKERALTVSENLRKYLKEQLPKDNDLPSADYFNYTLAVLKNFTKRLVRTSKEFTTGIMLPQHSPLMFLGRMMKSSHIRPLKQLRGGLGRHLSGIKERYEQEAREEIERKASQTFAQRVREEGLFKSLFSNDAQTLSDVDNIVAQRLEEEWVIANVIGLAIVISVHFSKACTRAVDFYLEEKFSREREKLAELCRDPHSSNEEIMAYVWEAQRISQLFGLWRNVNLSPGEKKIIKEDFEYPDVTIEHGDSVFADFTFAHNDPKQLPEPEKVKLDRKLNSLLGLGVHQCPAGSFIDHAMAEILRVIFKQQDLKRASGRIGQLKSVTLHPNAAPWDSEIYLDEAGGFTYYPKKMVIEFTPGDTKNHGWRVRTNNTTADKYKLMMARGCSILVIIIGLILTSHIFISFLLPDLFSLTPTPQSGTINTQCRLPLVTIKDWHVRTFRPWLGLFGEPAPIIYRMSRAHKAHQISVANLDIERDIKLHMWIDSKEYIGSRDVAAVDCGEGVAKCPDLDFGFALFVIPAGTHTVRAEIRMRNASEAFVWGKERRRRIMWLVQQCG